MPVKTNAEGGGGVGSDECTLLRANVPIGFKAVTADSNDESVDGTFNPDTTAADSHVLEGQSYIKFNPVTKLFERRFGARKNNGSLSASLNCGESFNIPVGDILGGKVTANSLASQTPGTATAADIILGKKATVNGIILTGTKPNNGTINATLKCGESRSLPAGSIDGGTITAASLASQTGGVNLADGEALAGRTFWRDGVKRTGSMPDRGSPSYSLPINGTQSLPVGRYTGGSVSQNIPVQGRNYLTPKTYNQVVCSAGRYVNGEQGLYGDPNLIPANIAKDRIVFGVRGTAAVYGMDPMYFFNKGAWSNLQTTGMANATPSGSVLSVPYIRYGPPARLNQLVDLTAYKYIKVAARSTETSYANGNFTIGISTKANESDISNCTAKTSTTGLTSTFTVGVLNVSAISGFYYIYVGDFYALNGTMYISSSGEIQQIFLSAA